MNSVSRATLVTGVASEMDSDFPLAPNPARKNRFPFAWFDAPGPQDGKTQKLLDRLEAENAKLRARVIELVPEIRTLRDRDVEWRGCGLRHGPYRVQSTSHCPRRPVAVMRTVVGGRLYRLGACCVISSAHDLRNVGR
jgi:hypothetical protein